MTIDEFIEKLSRYENSDKVFNMYSGDTLAAKKCRENLKNYLEKHENAQILLVGEAPGHRGCARTGVPFTSDNNEMSAGIIQKSIEGKNVLMWNAFPFHPHRKNNRDSNRTPNIKELIEGEVFFAHLLSVFPNVKYFGAVGRVAERMLRKGGYDCSYIRHPAHGGKRECEKNIQELLRSLNE